MEKKDGKITFDGKPLEIRFDNYTLFRLVKSGLGASDMFLREYADEDKYCRAWAAALGAKYDGDARAFVNRFGGDGALFRLNAMVVDALERDGVIKGESESAKDDGGQPE